MQSLPAKSIFDGVKTRLGRWLPSSLHQYEIADPLCGMWRCVYSSYGQWERGLLGTIPSVAPSIHYCIWECSARRMQLFRHESVRFHESHCVGHTLTTCRTGIGIGRETLTVPICMCIIYAYIHQVLPLANIWPWYWLQQDGTPSANYCVTDGPISTYTIPFGLGNVVGNHCLSRTFNNFVLPLITSKAVRNVTIQPLSRFSR